MKTKYFISTAIPYINAKAHIGHAQEFLLADSFKQVLTKQGHEVILQSGTDDNSLKNLKSASELNIPIKDYITSQGQVFKNLLSSLNIQVDLFVQTSSIEHHESVKKFIKALDVSDLYANDYQGFYCQGCEDFLQPSDLTNNLCPDHKKVPEIIHEKNIFFKLSKYQERIYQAIDSDEVKITPSWRKKEILNFISQGLTDISISRPKSKYGAVGVDFPDQEDQCVYVWIDALINYLSGIGYGQGEDWKQTWDESYKIHVIGKNVWKFHAIYWIGLLLSANISLPNEIVIHGFLTNEGVKISKSLGNAIDPLDIIKEVSPSTLRLYLLGKLNYEVDGDFSLDELKHFYLQELLNPIGNLYPRVFSLADKSHLVLKRIESPLDYDFRNLKQIFSDLQNICWCLNKEINDSLIWKQPESEEKNLVLQDWGTRLNKLSDRLEIFFPDKKIEIIKGFSEKIILFNK